MTPRADRFHISGTERAGIPARRIGRPVDEALKAFRM